MARVADQRWPPRYSREQPLAELDRLVGVALVEPVRAPGLLACLDDDGRQVLAELVRVDLEPAVLGALEREREGREGLARAEPDESALAHVDCRARTPRRAACARAAVDAVGRDHQVGVRELAVVVDLALEMLTRRRARGARSCRMFEQLLALDAAEPVTAACGPSSRGSGRRCRPSDRSCPTMAACDSGSAARKPCHRLVGEHDAPAEGVVGPVALVDLDARARQRLLEQDGRIQPRRPAAGTDDTLHVVTSRSRAITSLNI